MRLSIGIFFILLAFSLNSISQQVTAKFGDGIRFYSQDSSALLKFNVRIQNLFEGEYNINNDGYNSNFLVRRARIKFKGFAYSPKFTYKIELGLSSNDISTINEDNNTLGASRIILDMYLQYQFQKHWSIIAGQNKLPGNRERVVSSGDLQFVDRSLVNSYFNIDRDFGLQLNGNYPIDKLIMKTYLAISQGEGRNIGTGNKGGYNYTARVDFLPFGEFEGNDDDYVLSDLNRQSNPKLAIGITGNYNHNAVRQQGQLGKFVYELDNLGNPANYAEYSLTMLEADLLFKYRGFSSLMEFAHTTADNNPTTSTITPIEYAYHVGYGFNAQAGYLFKNNVELAGRFTGIVPYGMSQTRSGGLEETEQWTLCFSKYFVGHNLKIQADASWTAIEDSQEAVMIRAQVEMQF